MKKSFPKQKKEFFKNFKAAGYTLLETLVATGIAAIVITSAIGVTGNAYRSQRKVQFAQDFYSESRFLMERISQIARNNTLDYDRYFLEVGPEVNNCTAFNEDQIPGKYRTTEPDGLINYDNSFENRSILGYESIFYWDTDANDEQDRNLGGVKPDGTDDDCTKAWEKEGLIQELFLINGNRTMRTAIRRTPVSIEKFDLDQDGVPETDNPDYDTDDPDFDKLELQRQIGADIDGDGSVEIWAPDSTDVTTDIDGNGTDETGLPLIYWDETGSQCIVYIDENINGEYDNGFDSFHVVSGDKSSKDFCQKAHDFASVSPSALEINELSFSLSPSRDPYLNFRVDSAQIHPQVFISLSTEVRDPEMYDFETKENAPHISFQTMVSSRVFGNPRK